jgi:hypothetical protein
MDIKVPDVNEAPRAYWNSNTRHNAVVLVVASNENDYAVWRDGHVYIVPKENITPEAKVYFYPSLVTTAPKPEGNYGLILTAEEWNYFSRSVTNADSISYMATAKVFQEIAFMQHTGKFTYEWFFVSPLAAYETLNMYGYTPHKKEDKIKSSLPSGPEFATVVRQLWDEKNRRDGVVLK